MRIFFALLAACFLILPLGCGGSDEASEGDGAPVTEPDENTTPEEMNEMLPPPE